MLSALTSPTRSYVLPRPLLGALLGALLLSSVTAVSVPVSPDGSSSEDKSFAVYDTVPEPGYSLLGACIGCALLLHRRRSVDLATSPRASHEPPRALRKFSPGTSRAPLRRRTAASGRLIDTSVTGRASLRPLRAR